MGSVGVWGKWDKESNGKECVLRRNVSGMRKDSPMLSANTRNDSLDDAFDELLHWASTDDAGARRLVLRRLVVGSGKLHYWPNGFSRVLGCPRCRFAGQERMRRNSTWRSTTRARFGEAEHFDRRLRVAMDVRKSQGVRKERETWIAVAERGKRWGRRCIRRDGRGTSCAVERLNHHLRYASPNELGYASTNTRTYARQLYHMR